MQHRDSHRGNRRLTRAIACTLEHLEKRQLLAGDVFNVNKIPVFTPSSSDINDLKNGPLGNATASLAELYIDFRKFIRKGGKAADYTPSDDSTLVFDKGRVGVLVRVRSSMADASALIRSLGGELIFRSNAYKAIETYLPIGQLSSLAQNAKIATVNPLGKRQTRLAGTAENQAEYGLNADSLRATFGLTGEGVKIGVISDSVNSVGQGLADSHESGDLPAPSEIDVLQQGSGDDEGRAMLELIHDIAPKASLAFIPDGGTQLQFANNIRLLVEAGCDVIVDDIGYSNESVFQEGVINQAVTNATEAGVVYVSAAGNSGAAGYQDTARWVRGRDGRYYMDWDANPDRVDTALTANFVPDPEGSILQFAWDDPFNGVAGSTKLDLDITITDPLSGAVVYEGITNNIATQVPAEFVTVGEGEYEISVSIADMVEGADLPTRLALVFLSAGDSTFSNIEYPGLTRYTVLGHASGADALSVAATPFWESPAYDTDGVIDNASYSSYGPNTLLFKMNGERRVKPVTLLKPDVTGIDSINTSFFGGEDVGQDSDKLQNFSGTSAAAPNVAAVAALLVQLANDQSLDYTPAEIKNALIESAKTQPVNGAKSGEWTENGGFGLIDGVEAARILVPDLPSADVQRVVPYDNPRGLNSLTINFNEPVSGFDLTDITLTRSGGGDLISTDPNISLNTNDNLTWVLSGLKTVTKRRGTYKLTINGAGFTDEDFNTGFGTQELFNVSGKPTNLTVTAVSYEELDLNWYDNATGEIGYKVYRSMDPNFIEGVKTFNIGANTTKFRDIGLNPVTRYYYKVKPVYEDESVSSPPSAIVYGTTLATNEIVVDNSSSKGATIVGEWSSVSSGNRWGVNYLHDQNSGKGDKSVSFAPSIQAAGDYFVYLRWVPSDKNATKVPIDVLSADGTYSTVINQRENNTWKLIGKFRFNKGAGGYLKISTTGTKGFVIADAARFVKADNGSGTVTPGTGIDASIPFSVKPITGAASQDRTASILLDDERFF